LAPSSFQLSPSPPPRTPSLSPRLLELGPTFCERRCWGHLRCFSSLRERTTIKSGELWSVLLPSLLMRWKVRVPHLIRLLFRPTLLRSTMYTGYFPAALRLSRPPARPSSVLSADENVSCEQSPTIRWWQDRLSSPSPTSAPCPSSVPATPTSSPSPTPSTPPPSSPPSRVRPSPQSRVLKRLPRRVPVEAALFPRAGGGVVEVRNLSHFGGMAPTVSRFVGMAPTVMGETPLKNPAQGWAQFFW
jgi:hypothetical protein